MNKSEGKFRIIEIDDVGPVLLRRSNLAGRVNIRIRPYHGVRVSVPRGVSFEAAEQLVRTRTAWIQKHLGKVRAYEQSAVVYDGSRILSTRRHKLEVRATAKETVTLRIGGGLIRVDHPRTAAVTDSEVQAAIVRGLIEAFRREAREDLPPRVACLAEKHGFRFNKVFIKNHRSRWGSCSGANNINLSLHLMRLPDELVDYVILHELVHTEIKNHSPAFWSRLGEVCENLPELRKRLRRLQRNLAF